MYATLKEYRNNRNMQDTWRIALTNALICDQLIFHNSGPVIFLLMLPLESLLNDVIVRFGHRSFGYGGTNENPDSYYDMYVAEFAKDGINYSVLSSNINEQEFVKMVDSLTAK